MFWNIQFPGLQIRLIALSVFLRKSKHNTVVVSNDTAKYVTEMSENVGRRVEKILRSTRQQRRTENEEGPCIIHTNCMCFGSISLSISEGLQGTHEAQKTRKDHISRQIVCALAAYRFSICEGLRRGTQEAHISDSLFKKAPDPQAIYLLSSREGIKFAPPR